MKNLDKLQEDILDILNYSKELIDESTCKDNISRQLCINIIVMAHSPIQQSGHASRYPDT